MGLAQNWTSSVWQTSASANREDRILVQPKAGVDLAALADFHAAQKSEVLQTLECLGRLQVLRVPEGETTRNDTLGTNSNYGATNVNLAAPGEQIYSTFGATDTFYFSNTGTSFAAPYGTGALALMLAKYPTETHQQIIARVLDATDPLPELSGKCVTGGRLNLRLSPPISLTAIPAVGGGPFQLRVSAGPNRTCVVEFSTNLTAWSPIRTNLTSASGTFVFIDDQPPNSAQRFFRAVSDP